MQSILTTARKSLATTLFILFVSIGFLGIVAVPFVALQLETFVCAAGETMVYETYVKPGGEEQVQYFCEGAEGRLPANDWKIIGSAIAVYIALGLAIVWPIVTALRHKALAKAHRLDRDGIPAIVHILSVEQTRMEINHMPVIKYHLRVEPEGQPAFEVHKRKTTPEIFIPHLLPGRKLKGLIDPETPGIIDLDFAQLVRMTSNAGTDQHEDPHAKNISSLRSLKTMLDEGLIEPSEYAAKKAEIMDRL